MSFKEKSTPQGEELEKLLTDLEKNLQIRLTVHDRTGIFRDPDGKLLLATHRRKHQNPYCELGRQTRRGWNQNCQDHCRNTVNQMAMKKKEPFTHLCWKGVQEMVVPIIRDNVHLATLFAGLFRDPHFKKAPKTPFFPAIIEKEYLKLPVSEKQNLESIGRILHVLSQGILSQLDRIHSIPSGYQDRKTEIQRFIYYRSNQSITLQDLSLVLFLSPSRTSHVVQELFGVSFQEMVLSERMIRARTMLLSSTCSVGEIARRVGIFNEYYFNRAFKKRIGMAPGQYRKKHWKEGLSEF